MQSIELITSQYPGCMQDFNRRDYAVAFDNYSRSTERFYADLKCEDIGEAVSQLTGIAKDMQKRRFGSKTRLFDFRAFLCVYLCPAALAGNDVSRAFAEAVAEEWNRQYPKLSFVLGTYEDIAGGFRDKPFGF